LKGLLARVLAPLIAAVLLAPAAAGAASRTHTPIRIPAPSPGNASVAGFHLKLVSSRSASSALSVRIAAGLPKDVGVVSVLARQTRSDRVKGVIVVLNRAEAVAAAVRPSRRVITVNLRHAAAPTGLRVVSDTTSLADVLRGRHGKFRCGAFFSATDLRHARPLGGNQPPGLSSRDAVADACAAAGNRSPFRDENHFRQALNARTGFMTFTRNAQLPGDVDGSVTFNYAIGAFGVLADPKHSFTGCRSAAAGCTLGTIEHQNDYVLFNLLAPPDPRNTPVAFGLTTSPPPAADLPFRFFGVNAAGRRFGPLLTQGP
jgi:hypothetical protein